MVPKAPEVTVVLGFDLGFGAELELPAFRDGEVFDCAETPTGLDGPADPLAADRETAEVVGELEGLVAFEVGVDVALALGEENVVVISVEDDVAEAKGGTGLILHDTAQLPAAGDSFEDGIPAGAPMTAFAEGEFPDAGAGAALGAVKIRDDFVGPSVLVIEHFGSLHVFWTRCRRVAS